MKKNDPSSVKILIIEDERNLIELLEAKLEKEGYNIVCAYDGAEGLEKIRSERPDLILLDIVMPKIDGYGVLEKMSDEKISIPVIIISNSGQPVEIEKTKKLGAVDHLIKTEFSPVDVLKKIRKYLARSENSDGPVEEDDELPPPLVNKDVMSVGVNVLLVEDDSFLREICSKKLANEGFTVYTAIDGEEALKLIKKIRPGMVLLDIILPTIDGFQVLEKLRKDTDAGLSKIPVVMLSNLGQEDDIKKAVDLGANDYMVKAHFTTEEIAKKLKTLIKKS